MALNPSVLTGSASDDSGSQSSISTIQKISMATSTYTGTAGAKASLASSSTPPGSVVGTNNDPFSSIINVDNEEYNPNVSISVKPGKRLKNPLGYLASYTYQLSLYMITPDAYDVFVESGRKNINALMQSASSNEFATRRQTLNASTTDSSQQITGGAYLIAQSGGIGVTNGEKRAPGFDYDLLIDGLKFDHYSSPQGSGSSTQVLNMEFKITEPYGFSFISKLRNSLNAVQGYSGDSNLLKDATEMANAGNATRQFFIIGIRFFGWDQSGREVKGSDVFDGVALDPNSTGTALFETYYDFIMQSVKFKLDGRTTTYTISGTPVSTGLGAGIKNGINHGVKECSGVTVHDALCGQNGLITKLNTDQTKQAKSVPGQIPMKYKIRWVGDDITDIALANLKTDADNSDKSPTAPSSTATTIKESNDATALTSSPKLQFKKVTHADNQPIIQLIENTILNSEFIEKSMKVTYTNASENDPNSDSPSTIAPSVKSAIKWFNISPEISDIKWDPSRKDWVYTITYVIQTYLIPVIDHPLVSKTTNYYGPHKRYDYWYAGLNTEVLSYQCILDNTFYNVVMANLPDSNTGDAPGNANNNQETATPVAMMQAGQIPQGGDTHRTSAASSIRTSLYDPGGFVNAVVNILGDPDYLMKPTSSSEQIALNKFYENDSYTINPSGGQVFFEIDFKEAVDYSSSDVSSLDPSGRGVQGQGGTLSINDSILFWDYPPQYTTPDPITGKPLVQGISYQLIKVTSSFNSGSFQQTLEAKVNTFGGPAAEQSPAGREVSVPATPAAQPADNKNAAVPQSQPTDPTLNPRPAPIASPNTTSPQITTPTGPGGRPVAGRT